MAAVVFELISQNLYKVRANERSFSIKRSNHQDGGKMTESSHFKAKYSFPRMTPWEERPSRITMITPQQDTQVIIRPWNWFHVIITVPE